MNRYAVAICLGLSFAGANLMAQTAVTTGGGTANTVPVFNGSSTIGNSVITQSSGNVGIGVAAPVVSLDISGTFHGLGGPNPTVTTKGGYMGWNALGTSLGEMDFINNHGGGAGGFAFLDSAQIGASATPLVFITTAGNVGIGTTTPATPLQVLSDGEAIRMGANDNMGSFIGFEYLTGAGYDRIRVGYLPTVYGVDTGYGYLQGGATKGIGLTASAGATPTPNLYINSAGYVGIGTTTPGVPLEVNGILKLSSGSNGHITFADNTIQTTAWTGVLCGGDYAESVDVTGARDQYEPGDVLVIDTTSSGNFLKSSQTYSTLVAGIYSTKPGVTGRRSADAEKLKVEIPMAMVGIVPAKVSAENGAVKVGDLLVTASISGYAMKGTDHERMIGAVVGKALGTVDMGTGVIDVLVSLQ